MKAFKIFSQDRVHPLLLTIQLVVLKLWMSLGTGFFALFPNFKKKCDTTSALGVGTASALEPMDAAAYDASMVLEEEEEGEESEDKLVE